MKKILASIVEYKLNQHNLHDLIHKMSEALDDKSITYPIIFEQEIRELIEYIHPLKQKNIFSTQEYELLIGALKEMELLIMDYLTLTPHMRN